MGCPCAIMLELLGKQVPKPGGTMYGFESQPGSFSRPIPYNITLIFSRPFDPDIDAHGMTRFALGFSIK